MKNHRTQHDSAYDWRQSFQLAASLSPEASSSEKAERGREFERILHGMLNEAGLSPRLGYRPKGEEVDGSFVLHGRTMLLEAKWTKDKHPASSLYQFRCKVDGKLVGAIGLFISMAGFSEDALSALTAGKELNLILADGEDIRAIASGNIGIKNAISHKLRAAAETGIPFFPVAGIVQSARIIFVAEGAFDERVLNSISRVLGSKEPFTVIPASGPTNMPMMARALLAEAKESTRFILIADGEALQSKTAQELRDFVRLEAGADSAKLVIFHPDLDRALGIAPADGSWLDRRKLRNVSDHVIDQLIESADLRKRAESTLEISTLLQELNIDTR